MQSFAMLMVRSLLYLLFIVGVTHIFAMEGYSQLTNSDYGEHSATEQMHNVFAFISCVVFFITAKLSQSLRPAVVIVGTLVGLMLIREFDAFLDDNFFDGAWQVLVYSAIAVSTLYLFKQPYPVKASLVEYSRSSSAGIFLSGILVVLVFSRLFGRGSFWEAVMGDGYVRVVKNIAEEGTELIGYALLVIAAVEFLWQVVSKKRADKV
ncbi:hypothetical protein WNY58_10985 [Neptuniibacter pectenicola]|jgi:hypothetical protein|uniref:Transporter n=1 Tax=Neptuniibacter pectenicola TaxID=1806669 RepID=A0ABU9TT69_9GAMM|nr:hypothetical protein [Neptuniibacter pectenicola]|tara:strand:+ start:317 stop:940 length:624 start_codon:yes stop_codon:yes gene_type:complete